jgi:hypothetical protein
MLFGGFRTPPLSLPELEVKDTGYDITLPNRDGGAANQLLYDMFSYAADHGIEVIAKVEDLPEDQQNGPYVRMTGNPYSRAETQ